MMFIRDGELVKLLTPVLPQLDIAEADARLQAFLREFYPILTDYLPGAMAPAQVVSAVEKPTGT